MQLSDTYKENLVKFYEARYITKDTTEMNRIWAILETESKALLSASSNQLNELRTSLDAIESNTRVVAPIGGNGLQELTYNDWLELAQFAQVAINDLRSQLGISSQALISKGSMDITKMVSDEYLNNDWSSVNGHYVEGIMRVFNATGQRLDEDLQPSGSKFNTMDYTMTQLKINIAGAIRGMMLYDYKQDQHFGHAMSITNMDSKYIEADKGNQYFGLWGNTVSKGSSLLFEFTDQAVKPAYGGTPITNPISKEALQAAVTSAENKLATAQAKLAPAQQAVTTATNKLQAAQGTLKLAQDKLAKAKAVPVQTPAAQKALDTAKANLATARAKLVTAKTELANAKSVLTTKEATLTSAQNTLRLAQADVATSRANVETKAQALATAKTNLTNAQNTLTASQKALADEKATLANLQTALTTAQNQLKTAKTTLTTVQGYANKLSQLKVELKPLLAEQATAKATLDNAKAKLATVTLEKAVAQANYDKAVAELKTVQAQYDAYQAYLAAKAEAERLEAERIEAERKAEEARIKAEQDAKA
ncbi:SEC10/PgrA surface exclusion domain-containing protein, partial [Streptococcus plurextorum]|uniref:SEC10/PgrA surface exclusion domain-containing protein n=1 Tax=Streptococcus plurextorum TaxID=456876 RepID=UPI0004853D5B